MFTATQVDHEIRQVLAHSAQHTVAVSKRCYNVSLHVGLHCAKAALDIYAELRDCNYAFDSKVVIKRSYRVRISS